MSEQNQTPETELDVQEFNNEMTQRRSKLAELRNKGNPFPNDFRREQIASDIHSAFGDKTKEELEEELKPIKSLG